MGETPKLLSDSQYRRRLVRSKRVAEVFARLKRRGYTERDLEFLLRILPRIPSEWENESWKQVVRRRARLAKKLRETAEAVSNDPDLKELSFEIRTIFLNGEPGPGMVTLAQLLRREAWHLEPKDKPYVKMADGSLLTAREFEERTHPKRKVAFNTYVLKAVFDYLQGGPHSKRKGEQRAPNREAEILASVLLGESIRPGTLTQLRKTKRRRYYRDE